MVIILALVQSHNPGHPVLSHSSLPVELPDPPLSEAGEIEVGGVSPTQVAIHLGYVRRMTAEVVGHLPHWN